MRKQVILTILIISNTFGAEAEFQIIPVRLRPAAHCAAMMGALLGSRADFLRISPLSLYLFRRKLVPVRRQVKNQEIQKRYQRRHAGAHRRKNSDLHQGHS